VEEVQGSYRDHRCHAWAAGCNRGIRELCAIAVQHTYIGGLLTTRFNRAWARFSDCKPFAAQIRLGLYQAISISSMEYDYNIARTALRGENSLDHD
jgi:hypothetical protein